MAPGHYVWMIAGCKNCGLVFCNPPLSQNEADALYAPAGEWADAKSVDAKTQAEREQRPLKPKHAKIVNLLHHMSKAAPGIVLDFGCGPGHILRGFKEREWTTYGIDPVSADLLADSGHIMLREMPPTPMFDVIVMNHVLEHLPDPLDTLQWAQRCINIGGLLYIGTPTLDRLRQHGKERYCINRKWHLCAFTLQSMQSLLARAGFRVVKRLRPDVPQRMAMIAVEDNAFPIIKRPLQNAARQLRGGVPLPVRLQAQIANLRMIYKRPIKRRLARWRDYLVGSSEQ